MKNFILLILSLLGLEVFILFVFRVIFYWIFKAQSLSSLSLNDIVTAFFMGFRFDLQVSILILLPLVFLGKISKLSPFVSRTMSLVWNIYLSSINAIIGILYLSDFLFFDYFNRRIDATVFQFSEDAVAGFKMLQEGYPVISIVIIYFIYLGALALAINHLLKKLMPHSSEITSTKKEIISYFLFILIFGILAYGKINIFPLRWGDAFYSSNTFVSYLASNPLTYFLSTLKNSDVSCDINKTKQYYDVVSNFIGIQKPDPQKLSFARIVKPDHDPIYQFKQPNIVLILGESTSYSRSSLSGNPLNPTPFIKSMSDQGLTYTRYYAPRFGTPRSVYSALTGLADIETIDLTTRKPQCIKNNIPINAAKEYSKFYFIGGSVEWCNIGSVIRNIDGIKTYEELQYSSPHHDVWGISDVDLMHEVNSVLKKETKPFFAFIHMSSNHEPNIIPKRTYGYMKRENIQKADLINYSFDGKLKELNGQAFLDHSVKKFIEEAKKEPYFKNTIFIFIGDHGLSRIAKHMHSGEYALGVDTVHTPLIFYAPYLIKHKTIDYPVSEVDLMPTIAGLMGKPYLNTTYGRDILDKTFDQSPHFSFFTTVETNPYIELISKEYLFRMRSDGSEQSLFKFYYSKKEENLINKEVNVASQMKNLCRGLYEVTRYTRLNNETQKGLEGLKRAQ